MAHSVLTLEVREVDGHPAYEARKRVVAFLTERLKSRLSRRRGFARSRSPTLRRSSTRNRPGFFGLVVVAGSSSGTPL